jgi:hypothetical protein
MSSLLLKWLNEDVRLSTPVTNFENDFSTGYLLGEVLWRHNQQADFAEFLSVDKSDSKISNFTRLEPTLRRLEIPFDPRIAQQIMMKQKGAATKIIYQVKAALERVRAPVVGRDTGDGVKLVVVRDRAAKPSFEQRSKEMFEKSIRRVAENQNDLYLAKHMRCVWMIAPTFLLIGNLSLLMLWPCVVQ